MAINTPYLSVNTSAQSAINTPYLLGGVAGFPSDISSNGTLFINNIVLRGSETQVGNEAITGALSVSSGVTVGGNLVVVGTSALSGVVTLTSALNSASAASFGAITGTTGTLSSTLTVGGAITATSTASVGGLTTFTSAVTVVGPLNVNSQHTQANFLSYATTASATSLIIADGAFGIYFQSVTSCRLVYRSGNSTYTWLASTAGVL